jgi:hypothetical protein
MKKENRPMRVDYPNGLKLKLHNKSVSVFNIGRQDDVGVIFKIVTDDVKPRATSESVRGKYMKTSFSLTRESAKALLYCLNEYLKTF